MMVKVYVVKITNAEGKGVKYLGNTTCPILVLRHDIENEGIRYLAVATEDIDKEDITESKELTTKGKSKIGLSDKVSAKIIGTRTLDINYKVFQVFVYDGEEDEEE